MAEKVVYRCFPAFLGHHQETDWKRAIQLMAGQVFLRDDAQAHVAFENADYLQRINDIGIKLGVNSIVNDISYLQI